MDIDAGYIYIEKLRGGVQSYMMGSKYVILSTCFKLKNENNQILSFSGQGITFRISIKEIQEMDTYIYMSTYIWIYLHIYECFYCLYHSILKIIRDKCVFNIIHA